MYNYPSNGVRNYSMPPDRSLLSLIENQLSWFDETAYLSSATRTLCSDIISRSNVAYDLTRILPGVDQPHTQVYQVLRKGLYEWEMVERRGVVDALQPPIGSISTIEAMVQRFQENIDTIDRENQGDILSGEVEVDISDDEALDEAQNNAGDVEFGDDGLFFEP
jgi:hypothetical protein